MARLRRELANTSQQQNPIGRQPPGTISTRDMDAAIVAGRAAEFSQMITFIRRYRETWWLSTEAGWLPIQAPVAVVLDEHAEQMRQPARANPANAAVIRAVIELAREATEAASRRVTG